MPTRIISGEKIMDQLIDDLMSVDAGNHTSSAKFNNLETALKRSVKHRRKVKISEASEGPDDLMNSF